MAGATASGQFIVLLALPFLTRLYTPEEFGTGAVFAAVVGLFGIIATLRYELAIPLPRSDRSAIHLVALSFLILSVVAPMAGLSWLIAGHWFDLGDGLSDKSFAILIAFGVLTASAYQILNYWLVRKQKFGAIAITRIQQALAGNGTQLIAGVVGFGVFGIIFGQIVGQCAGLMRLAKEFRSGYRRTGGRVRLRNLKWAAVRYRQFPLFDSWAGLLSVAGAQAPVLLFTALFSPVFAGYYALAYRVLSAPIGLVGKAVSSPLLSRVVEARHHGDAAPLTAKLLQALAMVGLPPFAIMTVVAQDFVPLLFGSQWAPATIVVAWTALWVGWQFITSPLSVILIAIEAQRLNSLLQFGLVAMRVSALLGGAAIASEEGALAGFSVASVLGYAGYTAATGKAVGLSVSEMAKAICHPLAISAVSLAVAVVIPENMPIIRYPVVLCILTYWIFACWKSMARYLPNSSQDGLAGDPSR